MKRAAALLAILLLAGVARAQVAPVYEDGIALTVPQKIAVLTKPRGIWIAQGQFKEYAPPSPIGLAIGRANNALQAALPGAMLVAQFRPDLTTKYLPSYDEAINVGGVIARYCGATNCKGWGDGFDTAWILRGPRAAAIATAVGRFGVDPFATCSVWSAAVDCQAIQALATSTSVPMLYAAFQGALYIGQVSMDLRIPAARSWLVRRDVATLQEYGISGAERAAMFLGPKTGWYAAQPNAAANYKGCRAPGDRAYAGHLWGATKPATCTSGWDSQPLFDTPYRPGEYEAAYNAYLEELFAALDAAGLSGVQVIVQRAPAGAGLTLEQELPALAGSPRFAGEFQKVMNPEDYP